MMKFIQEHSYDNSKIVYEISEDSTLDEVLDAFACFLRGCGYNINHDDYLTLANEDVELKIDLNRLGNVDDYPLSLSDNDGF